MHLGLLGTTFSPFGHLEWLLEVQKWYQYFGPAVPPIKSHHSRLWPENCTYGYFGLLGHKMGQKSTRMACFWDTIQLDPKDQLKALVLPQKQLKNQQQQFLSSHLHQPESHASSLQSITDRPTDTARQ